MKLPTKPLLFLPVLLLAAGCASDDKEVPHAIGRAVTRTPGDAATYTVNDDDMQLERANRHARRTVGQFITALRNPQPDQRDFLVKKAFITPGRQGRAHLAGRREVYRQPFRRRRR